MMAEARLAFTFGAYFRLARNVSSPGPAFSIVETPVIRAPASPANSQPRNSARRARLKEGIYRLDASAPRNDVRLRLSRDCVIRLSIEPAQPHHHHDARSEAACARRPHRQAYPWKQYRPARA